MQPKFTMSKHLPYHVSEASPEDLDKMHHTVVNYMTELHKKAPVLNADLGGHFSEIMSKTREGVGRLYHHLKNVSQGNIDEDEGGSGAMGGSLRMGGAFGHASSPAALYMQTLHMNPYHIESIREAASQLLGGKPSPFHRTMATGSDALEAEPEDYENVVRMPNAHAMGRMIEAEHGYTRGGGFFKALRHATRLAGKAYKFVSAGLGLANKYQDQIMQFVPDDYKGAVSGALKTAATIDAAINPLVEATVDAAQETSTPEQRQKLKKMAEESIDQAVATHMPAAQPYYQAAKKAGTIYQDKGLKGLGTAALEEGAKQLTDHVKNSKVYDRYASSFSFNKE